MIKFAQNSIINVVAQKKRWSFICKKNKKPSVYWAYKAFTFFNKQKRPITLAEPPKFGRAAGGGAILEGSRTYSYRPVQGRCRLATSISVLLFRSDQDWDMYFSVAGWNATTLIFVAFRQLHVERSSAMEKWQEALALISLRETELQESFEKGQARHMFSRICQIQIYEFFHEIFFVLLFYKVL